MIEATNESKARELVPAGTHIARCYSMVHVGTNSENIMGQIKFLNKVRITWELPTELRVFNEEKGEQPMVISQEYTLSTHEKSNLRKHLEGWRGQGFTEEEAKRFNISVLLEKACMLSIIHKPSKSSAKMYAIISSISSLPKGMECPIQINPTFEFNFTDKFNLEQVEKFPDFIKDKIKSSEEFKMLLHPQENDLTDINDEMQTASQDTDDLPF